MLMKHKLNSKNFASLLLLCVVSISTVYAQKARGHGDSRLIPEDVAMVEVQRRNAVLAPAKRRSLDQSITELVKSMNGTWELVDRMVSNKGTDGKMIIVPTKGTMTFNLRANGTSASGDFIVMEEGLGNVVISPDVGTDDPFALGSYNQVIFEAGFESNKPTGLGMNSFAPQEERIVISEQIVGEILGSYGIFREPFFFKQTSKDITQYMAMRSESGEMHFVAKNSLRSPGSEDQESADSYDIIKLTGDVMVLGISSKGTVDIWRRTSPTVQIHGKSLKSYWESVKASNQLLHPTFRKSQ